MPPERGGATLGGTLCFASELFIRQNRSDFRSEYHSQAKTEALESSRVS